MVGIELKVKCNGCGEYLEIYKYTLSKYGDVFEIDVFQCKTCNDMKVSE